MRFDDRLVLNQYLLGLFGVDSLKDLAGEMFEPEYEAWDEANVTRFHHLLVARFPDLDQRDPAGPNPDDLLRYDNNIVRHTLAISHHRAERLRWKYFQYLALLLTELYLDRYFRNPERLLTELNARVATFNAGVAAKDQVDPYAVDDLRKLAFWMATGSGKTLLMHVNILQFRHYLDLHNRRDEINRTILITPNEGLTAQHLDELGRSGIAADRFERGAGGLFESSAVLVLDIYKLADDMGEKTVAVDAFEGNNLVLIDEGHRGAAGIEWKDKRDRLAATGFAFEYSATFGQAVSAATGAKRKTLEQEYARAILFDYSYRFFYGDGYGKDFQILNLADGASTTTEHLYLIASLLAFYQQQRLYDTHRDAFAPYGLEKPLWVFVGSRVVGSVTKSKDKTQPNEDGSDILTILRFLTRFARERDESIALLDRLISGDTGLVAAGRDVFANKFPYLAKHQLGAAELYRDILRRFYNASAGGHLRVEELRGADGELALRLGDNDPFGVINVGDAGTLAHLCEREPTLTVTTRELSDSLFRGLNEPSSSINILIGSKKFTEGWNSYRVSSMGLMNVGKTEGSQIIQLFGRGVRLRGLEGRLQRSGTVFGKHPTDIGLLETLNVYGLHSDYMQNFKKYLAEEGVPANEGWREIVIPTVKTLPDRPLKTIRIRDGLDFLRDGPDVPLGPPPVSFRDRPIPLDYYPKVQSLASEGIAGQSTSADVNTAALKSGHITFLDLNAVYFELIRYKRERGWHNLTIDRQAISDLLHDTGWYTLKIPAAALDLDDQSLFAAIPLWQEIAVTLLRKYVDRFYKAAREDWEKDLREYGILDPADTALIIDGYQLQIPEACTTLIERLNQLTATMAAGDFDPLAFPPLNIFSFDQHLYRPLIHLTSNEVKVTPVALNDGERQFVADLKAYYLSHPDEFTGQELYLLRNPSRGKGVGFFEANNFYPDFILWLFAGDRQYITFIDPKGIRNLEGFEDNKVTLARSIKDIETHLGDPSVTLNSFIVSNTPSTDKQLRLWHAGPADFTHHHILFQQDPNHIETLLHLTVEAHGALDH